MLTTSIDDLFAKTLVGDYDGDEPWDAVRTLRKLGSREVFDRAADWCRSDDPLKRARGADVLAQFGKTVAHPSHMYPDDAFSAVSKLLDHEADVRPLALAVFALGHIGIPLAIPLIARFAQHQDREVRFAVACALGNFPNDEHSARALLSLTADVDDVVRDWATFGLGAQWDLDSPEIRDAMVRRLNDTFEDARQEAMVALAKRRDGRVLGPLIHALEQPAVSDCVIEAAYLMLGFDGRREGWRPQQYANALREQFAADFITGAN